MDLDDQLAALAAGELDEAEARAVRARVGADVTLRRRLARLERLERVLRGWDVDPMTDEQVAALDERVSAALDALDDGPMVGDRAPVLGIGGARDRHAERAGAEAAPTGAPPGRAEAGGEVVDLGAARRRRGIPAWASGLAAAAAALALVTSVGVGLDGLSTDDADTAATDDAGLAAEADAGGAASEEEAFADEGRDAAAAEDGAAEAAAADAGVAASLPVPQVASDLVLDESTLADLADLLPLEQYVVGLRGPAGGDDAVADVDEETGDQVPDDVTESVLAGPCVAEVLGTLGPDGVTAFVGTGTYEGVDAVVVVRLRETGDGLELATAAYDAATCGLLAEVVETR